jgi:hypothetical protein
VEALLLTTWLSQVAVVVEEVNQEVLAVLAVLAV